jgi:hypothetical protein
LFVIKNHAKEMNTTKLHTPAVSYQEQTQQCPLDMWLDEFQTWLDVVKYRTPIPILQSCGLVTTATESPVPVKEEDDIVATAQAK